MMVFFFFFFFFFFCCVKLILFLPVTVTLLDPGFPEVLHIKSFFLSFAHLICMCTILTHSLHTIKFF